ncbi:hypothetical protein FHR70_000191 [Microvirga lupini]|uniref:Uncharacterized protein n=1 Tax=Microvirga lupini TaxID=420324 RepID=A0A7W4YUT4_9HYPH|nr:Ig-like domain-containing protein [Microvirga lupini]MBB3017151.1 hypothetical protein [Microvirga lupini]
MRHVSLTAVGLLVLLTASAHAQTKDCEVPRFQTADNQIAEGRMMVRAGKQCTVRMGVSTGGFTDAKILKQPKRGAVVINGYNVVYSPKKGYTGADEFTYSRDSMDRYGNKAVRTVNIKVEVLP